MTAPRLRLHFIELTQRNLINNRSLLRPPDSRFRDPPASQMSRGMTMQFRTLDGSQNNLTHPDVNAAGTDFTRLAPANFADGISTMVDGPNPRTISNLVVAGDGTTPENPEGLSCMMYAWGQFIDHDLDLALTGGANIGIAVPAGDPNFPAGSIIPATRAVIDPATGAGTGHPATAVNAISGWLDGSMVYGSDAATAA